MTVRPGDRLGDWVVEGPLGEGGMGSVYRCHSVLAEDVRAAVKVLKREATAGQERFVQELRTLSGLHHPAIVRVLGGGKDDARGVVYMAMELVEGSDLGDRLAKGPLSPDEAVTVFGPVADALAYAHARGVAHRDIKPSNIMLRADGSPVIVDFGIAVAEGRTRHTKEGLVPGTVVYLPPEIFEGRRPDPKSTDAYALGVVIWESITGKAPFEADPSSGEAALLAQVMGQKLRSDALDPGGSVPKHVREAVRRTTDPSPDTRLVDLGAVRDLLTTGRTAVRGKPARRGGCAWAAVALASLGAGVAVAVAGVAVGLGIWWAAPPRADAPRVPVDLAATLEESARALERGDVPAARRAAGLALDDHPEDPHANLLYGQALLAGGEGLLARPFLCAAAEGGLAGRVPGHASGDLDCERGPGAASPLADPLALARVDLSGLAAEMARRAEEAAAIADAEEAEAEPVEPPRASPSTRSAPSAGASAPAVGGVPAPAFPSGGGGMPADRGGAIGKIEADEPSYAPVAEAPSYAPMADAPARAAPRAEVSASTGGRAVEITARVRRVFETCALEAGEGHGRVEIDLAIGPDGAVTGVTIASDTLRVSAVTACLRETLPGVEVSLTLAGLVVRVTLTVSPG